LETAAKKPMAPKATMMIIFMINFCRLASTPSHGDKHFRLLSLTDR
jgi:hypothetical protein